MFPDRHEPVLEISLIHKYGKIQNNGRRIRCVRNLSYKALETNPLRLIPLVIDRKFHNDDIGLDLAVRRHFFFIPDHSQLGRRPPHTRFDKGNIRPALLREQVTKSLIRKIGIRFRMDRLRPSALRDRASDIGDDHILAALCLFDRFFQTKGISHAKKRAPDHVTVRFRLKIDRRIHFLFWHLVTVV